MSPYIVDIITMSMSVNMVTHTRSHYNTVVVDKVNSVVHTKLYWWQYRYELEYFAHTNHTKSLSPSMSVNICSH